MKKIIYILVSVFILSFAACDTETGPTDQVSGPQVFETVESAESAINGIYRLMYVSGWSASWGPENTGIYGVLLSADLMAEDHLMASAGSGWFYEDYRLNVRGDYSNTSGRSYAWWNFFYTMISNINYIIASEETLSGDPDKIDNLIGQAYTMRAYCYFYLAQLYQQTYVGNEDKPGVPIYTEPSVAGTEGQPRGTLSDTYTRINEDIEEGLKLLKSAGIAQAHKSHIDYYVACGIKARIALVQERFADARDAAAEALSKPGLAQTLSAKEILGLNNADNANILWGFKISSDQTASKASFFYHMDADAVGYGTTAPKCISSWLYAQIPTTDDRKTWWRGELDQSEIKDNSSMQSYCQIKFQFSDIKTLIGDYIVMRAEEMLLIKAEAECHLKEYSKARQTVTVLGSAHDSKYAERLKKFTDSNVYNQNTIAPLATLMDEILFQRRVELWGETGRIFDLKRLKLGYDRSYTGSNHTSKNPAEQTVAGSNLFVMLLPQSELNGNINISPSDQNP